MQQNLAGMKLLTRVIARDQRQVAIDLEREVTALVDLVDRFYDILGDRHWIFTGNLPVPEIRAALDQSSTHEEAEARLIDIIADRVRGEYWQMGLFGHDQLRARRHNIARARDHYVREEWDSCALVLVTVMDGFVNDLETSTRRGLHAREPDEMVAWDSVVGHHKGLTAVMPVFLRPFKRRYDEEVFEVHRHGIVHGTVVNYNNQVVATKAWNLLAAVVDWATAKRKAAEPPSPKPTWRQTFGALMDHATAQRAREQFTPSSMRATEEGFETLDAVVHARGFLEAWKARQWGIVAHSLPSIITKHDSTDGARARRAKETYQHSPLLAYEIESITFPMLSVAVVRASATIGSRSGPIEMRWILEGEDGYPATPKDEDPRWKLGVYPPNTFFIDNPAENDA